VTSTRESGAIFQDKTKKHHHHTMKLHIEAPPSLKIESLPKYGADFSAHFGVMYRLLAQ